ncbi:HNH endonuclease signature motif containing protein [Micromonospora sp. CB01531]|uniref:HNH endonuclease signature motif containing protein n=1 Tax=Micromonospora sp. CB01531 TaxID=1718947 RepID=UPI0009F93781
MPRAKQRCPQVGCRNFKPCKTHQVWKPSSGMVALPSNWKTIRKDAEGFDEKRCYLCRCIDTAGAVDHKLNRASGGTNRKENLGWICRSCHKAKTEAEKQAGRKRRRNA